MMLRAITLCLLLINAISAYAWGLAIADSKPLPGPKPITRPDQIPHSHVTLGTRDVAAAWLAGATDRYPHNVLGDALEASRLMAETREGQLLQLVLPEHRVFEDLQVRLADLDQDGRDEIVVVESDAAQGAALAVYGVENKRIVLRALSPFIGRTNRWLNPVGVGDFDGDGRLDLAIVVTPHIGGILRLYRYTPPSLSLFSEIAGLSTHRMNSPELGLGQVVAARPRDLLLLPDQKHLYLCLIEWTPQGLNEITRVPLPSRIRSSLIPAGERRWHFEMDTGMFMEVRVTD